MLDKSICPSWGGKGKVVYFLCVALLLVLQGCAKVYTEDDFPDINDVPEKPTLKELDAYKKEAHAMQEQNAKA